MVKEGPPPPSPEANMGTGEMWAHVVKSIANNQRAGRAQQAVEIVSELPEFPAFRKMLDLGGDFIHDSIGERYDLIGACAALNYVRDDLDSFTKKIYDALNQGGVFISFCEGLTNERTKPDFVVTSMMSIALMGQDMCFDQGGIADSMLRVGFKSVRSRTLDAPWGAADLDLGRK